MIYTGMAPPWNRTGHFTGYRMVICSCRNIKESDFDNEEDLIKRLFEDDFSCGMCTDYYKYTARESIHTDTQKENYYVSRHTISPTHGDD